MTPLGTTCYPCTALVVDDDAGIRAFLQTLLTSEGYIVQLASCVADARALASEQEPDVIILDVALPDGNGIALCQALRGDAKLGDVPILMLTGLSDRDTYLRGLEVGADDFL